MRCQIIKLITVITPTYNRANLLIRCYKSLINQSSQNFEWLIIDDGSSDNTKEVVQELIALNKISIKYLYKFNGGKHTALNYGVHTIESKYTIILDSDDFLTEDAIQLIEQYTSKYSQCEGICGLSFLRKHSNNMVIVSLENNDDEVQANYINYRIKNGLIGDMAEVFYTEILKQYPFPEFEGEKFISEDIVWISIAEKYDMIFINRPLYICDYLQDGLTSNDKKNKFSSPLGAMLRGKMLMNKKCGIKSTIKGAIIYNCYKREINNKLLISKNIKISGIRNKLFINLMKLPGVFYNTYWKNIYKKY